MLVDVSVSVVYLQKNTLEMSPRWIAMFFQIELPSSSYHSVLSILVSIAPGK